jgi:hypothetical protein
MDATDSIFLVLIVVETPIIADTIRIFLAP